MSFIILVLASVLAVVWLLLLSMVSRDDWELAAINKVLSNRQKADTLRQKDAINAHKLAQQHGISAKVMKLFLSSNSEKSIQKLERQNNELQTGNLRNIGLLILPGYVLQRKLKAIGQGSVHKNILEKCIELYGKKYAANKAKELLAQMLSYSILGIAMSLTVGVLILRFNTMVGIAVLSIGTLLVLVLVYSLYDELEDRINKRRAAIERQFPNVVSKLALLITSGMITDRAWRETADSQDLELYLEMRKTSDELANLVNPVTAYSNFIDRCNTKETTKLASAIIQNLSKGNAEIGILLKSMAHDAWQERRHTAKRDSEAANSKLMIPTMLLFLAILIIIMVPVVINFSGLM